MLEALNPKNTSVGDSSPMFRKPRSVHWWNSSMNGPEKSPILSYPPVSSPWRAAGKSLRHRMIFPWKTQARKMDWFKGICCRKTPYFPWENLCSPVNFPLNQSIEDRVWFPDRVGIASRSSFSGTQCLRCDETQGDERHGRWFDGNVFGDCLISTLQWAKMVFRNYAKPSLCKAWC